MRLSCLEQVESSEWVVLCLLSCAGGGLFLSEPEEFMDSAEAHRRYQCRVFNNTSAAYADQDIYVVSRSGDCPIGYFATKGSSWCDRCPAGQYSITQNKPCENCEEGRANCSLGGAAIVPKSSYWHSNSNSKSQNCLDHIIR